MNKQRNPGNGIVIPARVKSNSPLSLAAAFRSTLPAVRVLVTVMTSALTVRLALPIFREWIMTIS